MELRQYGKQIVVILGSVMVFKALDVLLGDYLKDNPYWILVIGIALVIYGAKI